MTIYFNLLVWNAIHSTSLNYTNNCERQRSGELVPSAGQNAQDLDPGPARSSVEHLEMIIIIDN